MFAYFKSRFPVLPLYLYTFLTVKAIALKFGVGATVPVIIIAFVYLEFLFHLRVLDEFKDYYYDSANHTDRPVQKGKVTLGALSRLGIINVLVMLWLMDYGSPLFVVLVFMTGLVYTLFMYYEFFLGDWLRRRAGFYMVSHQVVFIPIFLSFYGVFAENVWFPRSLPDFAHLIYLLLPIAILEIGRKLRPRLDSEGKVTDDTYNYHWGEKRSVEVYCLLVITACAAGVMSGGNILDWGILAALGLLGISVSVFAIWQRKVFVKYSMAVTVAVVLLLPFLGIWM